MAYAARCAPRYTLRVVNTGDAQVGIATKERDSHDDTTVFVPPGLCRNVVCTVQDDAVVHAMPQGTPVRRAGAGGEAPPLTSLQLAAVPMTAPHVNEDIAGFTVSRDDRVARVAYGPPVRMYVNVDMSQAGIGVPPLVLRASQWAGPLISRDGAARSPPDKRVMETSAGLAASSCLLGREFLMEHDGELVSVPTAPTTYAYQLDSGSYMHVTVSATLDRVGDGARTVNVNVTFTGELVFTPQYF